MWQTAGPAQSKRGSHRSVLVIPAMQEVGPVPPNLSISRVNLYTVVFLCPGAYIDRYTNADF